MSTLELDRSTPRGSGSPRPRGAGKEAVRAAGRLLPLTPAIALMGVFLAGPIGYALYGSLTNATLSGYRAVNPDFVGIDNYTRLLSSGDFWESAWLTLVFVLTSAVIGQNVLGMFLAVLIEKAPKPVSGVVGALVVGAWVMPEIVAAFALYAFFSTNGTLNAIVQAFGGSSVTWLISFPLMAVILANVWRGTAFSMMVFGAGPLQRFFRITLPMVRRAIATNMMLVTLQTLGVFTLIWVMTAGGPGTKSSTLPVLAFQQAFKLSQVGYGTAIATVTLMIGAIFAVVYVKVLKPEVD